MFILLSFWSSEGVSKACVSCVSGVFHVLCSSLEVILCVSVGLVSFLVYVVFGCDGLMGAVV